MRASLVVDIGGHTTIRNTAAPLSPPNPFHRFFVALLGSRRNIVGQFGCRNTLWPFALRPSGILILVFSKMLPRAVLSKCCRFLCCVGRYALIWSPRAFLNVTSLTSNFLNAGAPFPARNLFPRFFLALLGSR